MIRKWICGMLLLALLLWAGLAGAASGPITRDEMESMLAQIRNLAMQQELLNDPAGEDALSEDGIAFQYEFGILYGDRQEMTEDTQISALLIMDSDIPGPRGVSIDWEVNRVMATIPSTNEEMYGTFDQALLYLEGSAEDGYSYGLVEREGQRIRAMEYGVTDPSAGTRVALNLEISGDGVNAIRLEGLRETYDREALEEFFDDLEDLKDTFSYHRVPMSLNGSELAMFEEADLDFTSLSYQTAEPEIFGDNVEDVLIDNEDGTWLRRVDGDGFTAVFTCNKRGEEARLISYTILSQDLEGPRYVRLGDLFHEDFNRFRHGEGELDENGMTETLYGTPGTPPYGLAEYGTDEIILRYVTENTSGEQIELLLRYEETVLTEITLHTL